VAFGAARTPAVELRTTRSTVGCEPCMSPGSARFARRWRRSKKLYGWRGPT